MTEQLYEKYWAVTLAYTNIYKEGFTTTLRIIVDFIDEKRGTSYSKEKYEELQARIESELPKNSASTRKAINQFVKLGFVRPGLTDYHPATKTFLQETDPEKKRLIFSRIVYTYSSFNSSVTEESSGHEINFFIKTLEAVGRLEPADIAALMTVDTGSVSEGYLDIESLARQREHAQAIGFKERKYNQASHFRSILKNLEGIVVNKDGSVTEKTIVTQDAPGTKASKGRDSYLQLLYKIDLEEEASRHFGMPVCMVDTLPYPQLIASHIKPYRDCSEPEQFDRDNGLLLNLTLDKLFDKGFISFAANGSLLSSQRLHESMRAALSNHVLHKNFLTPGRLAYLEHHRTLVFS